MKEKLKALKWQTYGQDFHLILFEIYVNPIPTYREALKEMGSYRRKENPLGFQLYSTKITFSDLMNVTDKNSFNQLS